MDTFHGNNSNDHDINWGKDADIKFSDGEQKCQ